MGLTVSEYLPEITDSIVTPGKPAPAAPATPQPTIPPTGKPAPSPAPPSPRALPTPATLANVALNRPATASSVRQWSDVIGTANAANDGQTGGSGRVSAWHSDSNIGKPEWWQVDLGKMFRITSVEIVFRNDQDQPVTRRNFEVLASNDPGFKTAVKLAERGETPVPFKQTWQANVTAAEGFRYVRVQKAKIDTDAYRQSFFTFEEARIFARPFRSTPTLTPQHNLSLKAVSLDELKSRRLLVGQSLNFAFSQTDERGLPVQLYAYNLPGGAALNANTGNFLFTPNSTQAGNVYQITFRAINEQTDKMARMDVTVVIDGAPSITLLDP
ncbi:MAG: discoidin domain-containing protein, partial [Blastocatellia bacterium]